jgi:lysophospholipase L1-like esterase
MRARRSVRRLTVAAFALTVAGGVLAPPASASTASVPHHRPALLAALGDSYSSGEGNPPFEPAGDGCDRSAQAWPLLAAAELGWRATNLACSGAQTRDVVNPYKNQPAQVDALATLRPRPRVVTITIGGNDAGFSTTLGACVAADCVATHAIAAANARIVALLPERLVDTYRAVEQAAPRAQLVVVGYPRLVPQRQADVTRCPWLTGPEREALNTSADLLNFVIRISAWRTGARFVDVSDTLAGHELCTKDSWIFPIGVGPVSSYWAHPILPGQLAIADRVADALSRVLHRVGPSRLHS